MPNFSITGYTYLPHLHFQVFVVTGINAWTWTDFDTLEFPDFDIFHKYPIKTSITAL
jgi:hypothetical protein